MRGYIRPRGKGTWQIEASCGFDPISGRRRRAFETVRGSKKDAQSALAALISRIETGSDIAGSKIKVDAYLAHWLDHQTTRVRPRTADRYGALIRLHINPLIGSVRLSQVRPAHVQAVVDSMRQGGAAARSIVQCYRVLSAALRQAVAWQLIAINPAAAVRPPRPDRPALTIPDAAALQRLTATAAGSRIEAAMTVEVGTGLRRSELLGLRWPDVDLDGARIHVTASLQRHKTHSPDGTLLGSSLSFSEPKTDRARRTLSLPRFAVDALKKQRRDQAERRLLAGEAWHDTGCVFDRGDGQPLDPDTFSSTARRIMVAAGLDGVRFHDLRHAYATTLLKQDVHPKVASEALGHSSVAFTMDVYSHVVPSMQQAAADAIDQAIGGSQR